MRKIFLTFIISLFLFYANAQIKFGVKAGVALNNRSGYKSMTGLDVKPLLTFAASFFSNIRLTDVLGLQPSIGYQPKGNKFANLTFEDQLGNPIGKGNMNFRFDYIELAIPLQYLISHNEKIKLFTGAGPYFAYAIAGKETWKNVSGQPSNEPKKNIVFGDSGAKRFDGGFVIMLSTQVQNKWSLSLYSEVGLVSTNASGVNSKNMSTGLTFGYLLK